MTIKLVKLFVLEYFSITNDMEQCPYRETRERRWQLNLSLLPNLRGDETSLQSGEARSISDTAVVLPLGPFTQNKFRLNLKFI